MKIPRILVIEDKIDIHNLFLGQVAGRADMVLVATIEYAEKIIGRENDFDAIALDGCVPGDEINTLPLLKKLLDKFCCPIIAISSSKWYNKELIEAGCTHSL